jgi:hypothetical protein
MLPGGGLAARADRERRCPDSLDGRPAVEQRPVRAEPRPGHAP